MFIDGPILGLRLVNFKLRKRDRWTDRERERETQEEEKERL